MVAQGVREYEQQRGEIQAAIHANNFKLDEGYKQKVAQGAETIGEGVREYTEMRKREKKEKAKNKLKWEDLLKEG